MFPAWFLEIRGKAPKKAAVLFGLVPVLLLLLIWWFITAGDAEERVISPLILPSPHEVVASVPELLHENDQQGRSLVQHVELSLFRVLVGFLLALAVTLPFGIAMGAFGSVRATFLPLATASGYIPIAALVPLTISLFGSGEKQRIIFLALAFAIYLLPLIVRAIDGVPDVYLRTAYTLGATRFQTVFGVLVPVALPDIWHSMRLAFGVGWTYLVLAEVVVKEGGLGDLIDTARRRALPGRVWLAILIITLIAWIADLAWNQAGKLLFPYRSTQR
ncbi:MAG: ABC transporter permease subunit [Planctomycetes bacterium]|nr:ABC transporter permease subunit [Planctomycetota bacterium]